MYKLQDQLAFKKGVRGPKGAVGNPCVNLVNGAEYRGAKNGRVNLGNVRSEPASVRRRELWVARAWQLSEIRAQGLVFGPPVPPILALFCRLSSLFHARVFKILSARCVGD